jgi:hypothetical protein
MTRRIASGSKRAIRLLVAAGAILALVLTCVRFELGEGIQLAGDQPGVFFPRRVADVYGLPNAISYAVEK